MTTRKIIPLLLAAALTLALAGCAESAPKDTPQRIGKSTVQSSISLSIDSLEEALDSSEIVADITIEEWLGEDIEHNVTFFKARINNTVIGNEYESITILQSGTSEMTNKVDPLYKVGDRLFLFLGRPNELFMDMLNQNQKAIKEFGELYKNAYALVIRYFLVSDVREYDNETYILGRFSTLKHWLEETQNIEIAGEEIRDIITDEFNEYDPLIKESYRDVHEYALYYDEIVKKIKELT